MQFLVFSTSVAAVIASLPLLHTAAPLKCTDRPILFQDAPEQVFVLNGTVTTSDKLAGLDAKTIESVQILCADELNRAFTIQVRRTAVVVCTVPGPSSVLQAAMDTIAALQVKHATARGKYARTLSALGWRDPSGLVSIELTVTDAGDRWSALGRHRHLIGERFQIHCAGNAAPASFASTRPLATVAPGPVASYSKQLR